MSLLVPGHTTGLNTDVFAPILFCTIVDFYPMLIALSLVIFVLRHSPAGMVKQPVTLKFR